MLAEIGMLALDSADAAAEGVRACCFKLAAARAALFNAPPTCLDSVLMWLDVG